MADEALPPTGMNEPEPWYPAWFTAPAAQQLLRFVDASGMPMRFVGGCVRDNLMGRPVHDIDIATPWQPPQVQEACARHGVQQVPTGLAHGTVTLVFQGTPVECTTLRRDLACDGRHARVAYTDDWQADALRRDFSINALMLSPKGRLYDYTGGVADARAGRVRFIGDPQTRIREDYLRLLRLFRFQATHGVQPLATTALAAAQEHAPQLAQLPVERCSQECWKMLAAPDPSPVAHDMQAWTIWPALYPEAAPKPDRLAALIAGERALTREGARAPAPDARVRLFALYGEDAATIAAHWRWSRAAKNFIKQVQQQAPLTDAPEARAAVYRSGNAVAAARVLYDAASTGTWPGWVACYREAERFQAPALPVSGKDLLALGMPGGKALGKRLKKLEAAWLASDFRLTRKELLALASDDR